MLLVDDDEAQLRQRQEQRRAGADHDVDRPFGDQPPGLAALGLRQGRVPDRGCGAEAALEARQPLGRERDFRQQHQDPPAAAQRRGHGLEIDLGLAGAGNAVKQRHAAARFDQPAQVPGSALLRRRKLDAMAFGIRPRPVWPLDQGDGLEQPGIGHRLEHAGPDLAGFGQRRRQPCGVAGQRFEHGPALRAQPLGHRPGGPAVGELGRPRLERCRDAERQLEHRSLGGQRLDGHMPDQGPHRRRHRRRVQHGTQRLEPIQRQGLGRALVPDHPDQLPAAEGHLDERPRRRGRTFGQQIVERTVEGDGHQDGHGAAGHADIRPDVDRNGADSIIAPSASAAGLLLAQPCHARSRRRRPELVPLAGYGAPSGRAHGAGLPRGHGQLRALSRRPPGWRRRR